MDLYSILLVIVWITILVICKNAILNKVKKFFVIPESNYKTDLLKNIENEYYNIKNLLNTEILTIKDDIYKNYRKHMKENIKEDIIQEVNTRNNDNEFDNNMYNVIVKTKNILKNLVGDFFIKIANYFKN